MIIKNDNIPFLEGYFISKKGRLWSRYDKSGHITKDSWHRVKYRSSTSVYIKSVLLYKIKFLYLYNENKY